MTSSPAAIQHPADEAVPYGRITWHLIPLLFLCYVLSFIDRINIGYAQFGMKHDLVLGDAAYGLAAGTFFVGYIIFAVPVNLLLQRFGAKRTISMIMILWGCVSALTMLVRTPAMLVAMRALLGVCEAGLLPGMILYLTYWYPARRRARVMSLFMTAVAISGVIVGPISGAILTNMDGTLGMHGWEWLFVVEGLPTIVVGVFAYFVLADRPADAAWLSAQEKQALQVELDREAGHHSQSHRGFAGALSNPTVYLLSIVLLMLYAGGYGVIFWMPILIRNAGVQQLEHVGWLSIIPYGVGAFMMVLWARRSDIRQERRWHVAIPMCVAAAGLALVTVSGSHILWAIVGLTMAEAGIVSAFPVFWTLPARYLSGTAAAAGLALINSIGTLGGLLSPWLVGILKEHFGSFDIALYAIIGLILIGVLVLLIGLDARNETAEEGGLQTNG